jgi:hypothetical protein
MLQNNQRKRTLSIFVVANLLTIKQLQNSPDLEIKKKLSNG